MIWFSKLVFANWESVDIFLSNFSLILQMKCIQVNEIHHVQIKELRNEQPLTLNSSMKKYRKIIRGENIRFVSTLDTGLCLSGMSAVNWFNRGLAILLNNYLHTLTTVEITTVTTININSMEKGSRRVTTANATQINYNTFVSWSMVSGARLLTAHFVDHLVAVALFTRVYQVDFQVSDYLHSLKFYGKVIKLLDSSFHDYITFPYVL